MPIRMVMPVKKTIRQLTDQMVVLTDQMDAEQLARVREQYQKKHAQAKLRLLQALEEVPERYLSMDIVRQRLNISSVTLKAMQQEKVIAVISKERYRTAGIYDYKGISKSLFIVINPRRPISFFADDCDDFFLLHRFQCNRRDIQSLSDNIH